MATIKVFDSTGCKELKCFNTLDNVPYIEEEDLSASEDSEAEE